MFNLFALILDYREGDGERQTQQDGVHGNAGDLAAPCDLDGGRMEQALGDYVIHLEALKKITRIADKCHR
jgi:hypothetical protein